MSKKRTYYVSAQTWRVSTRKVDSPVWIRVRAYTRTEARRYAWQTHNVNRWYAREGLRAAQDTTIGIAFLTAIGEVKLGKIAVSSRRQ